MLNPKFSSLNPMDIGDRIKHVRTKAGLTQEQLGKAAGVSKGSVSQWEGGSTKNLRMKNLFGVADATGFSVRWIAIGEGPEKIDQSTPLPPDEIEERARNLTDEQIANLLELAIKKLRG